MDKYVKLIDFLSLVATVADIDKKAADYMLKIAKSNRKVKEKLLFAFDGNLVQAFLWTDTPLGLTFWNNLSEKILPVNYNRHHKDYVSYFKLVVQVEKVDREAAKYLVTLAMMSLRGKDQKVFEPNSTLGSSFVWANTKQGFNYWKQLSEKIKSVRY